MRAKSSILLDGVSCLFTFLFVFSRGARPGRDRGLFLAVPAPPRPQLYVQGELVGGLDIVKEMKHEGALAPQLGVKPKVTS